MLEHPLLPRAPDESARRRIVRARRRSSGGPRGRPPNKVNPSWPWTNALTLPGISLATTCTLAAIASITAFAALHSRCRSKTASSAHDSPPSSLVAQEAMDRDRFARQANAQSSSVLGPSRSPDPQVVVAAREAVAAQMNLSHTLLRPQPGQPLQSTWQSAGHLSFLQQFRPAKHRSLRVGSTPLFCSP